MRSLYRRRFCLDCSPFGAHNTATSPPGILPGDALIEFRRRRRNAKTYSYQKKRRRSLKIEIIDLRGGRCEACGYARTLAELGQLVDDLTVEGINEYLEENPPRDFTVVTLGPAPLRVQAA